MALPLRKDTTALLYNNLLSDFKESCNTELTQWFTSIKLLLNAKKSKFTIRSPINNTSIDFTLRSNEDFYL